MSLKCLCRSRPCRMAVCGMPFLPPLAYVAKGWAMGEACLSESSAVMLMSPGRMCTLSCCMVYVVPSMGREKLAWSTIMSPSRSMALKGP